MDERSGESLVDFVAQVVDENVYVVAVPLGIGRIDMVDQLGPADDFPAMKGEILQEVKLPCGKGDFPSGALDGPRTGSPAGPVPVKVLSPR